MKFLIIQILLNVIAFGTQKGKYLKIYKWGAYIFYPVLLTLLIVTLNNEVTTNEQHGSAVLDITDLFYPKYYITIILSVIIQILFNTQYVRLWNLRKN